MELFSFQKPWRIQDFPEEGANPRGGGANLLFYKIVAQNFMQMKGIGSGVRVPNAPPDSPMGRHLNK